MTACVSLWRVPLRAITPPLTVQLFPPLSTIRLAEGIIVPLAEALTVLPELLEPVAVPPELLELLEPVVAPELLELLESDVSPPRATIAVVGDPKLASPVMLSSVTAKLLPLSSLLMDTEMVFGDWSPSAQLSEPEAGT